METKELMEELEDAPITTDQKVAGSNPVERAIYLF
jgi:hypothetical protein